MRQVEATSHGNRSPKDQPSALAALLGGGPMSGIQQAKSTRSKRNIFTNCGEGDGRKLTRVPFKVSRLMEFCTLRELVNQTGHNDWAWPLVIIKECIDNGIDNCEEHGIAPQIEVAVTPTSILISDNGTGIPAEIVDGVLDYSTRISSREAYVSPTRGAQGNALKTILAMGYVLSAEDGAGENAAVPHGYRVPRHG
jgi:hypothetical protein